MYFLLFFISSTIFADSLSQKVFNALLEEPKFKIESHEVRGVWKENVDWYEYFCNNSNYNYKIFLTAFIDSVDFDLRDDGSIDIYSTLNDIWGMAEGSYRSTYTLCMDLGNYIGVGADKGEILVKVIFPDGATKIEDLKVQVIYTRLYYLRVHPYIPDWMSKILSDSLNIVLEKMWRSSIGSWVSDLIVEIIKKEKIKSSY